MGSFGADVVSFNPLSLSRASLKGSQGPRGLYYTALRAGKKDCHVVTVIPIVTMVFLNWFKYLAGHQTLVCAYCSATKEHYIQRRK